MSTLLIVLIAVWSVLNFIATVFWFLDRVEEHAHWFPTKEEMTLGTVICACVFLAGTILILIIRGVQLFLTMEMWKKQIFAEPIPVERPQETAARRARTEAEITITSLRSEIKILRGALEKYVEKERKEDAIKREKPKKEESNNKEILI